jgi:hypothetical protein
LAETNSNRAGERKPEFLCIHLHTLARICLLAQKTGMLAQLRQAPDPSSMRDCPIAAEQEALAGREPTAV